MLKRVIFSLCCLLFFIINIPVSAQNIGNQPKKYFYDGAWHEYDVPDTYIQVNGEKIETDVPPLIFQNRSVVPARTVFEKLGANVTWDAARSQVGINMRNINIILNIDDPIAIVNGRKYTMEIPPKIINSRTMIPVRFVAETLGMKVEWIEKERIITIDNVVNQELRDISIFEIKYIAEDTELRVIISADSEIEEYQSMELDNSPRLVLDISNAVLNAKQDSLLLPDSNIYRVRAAQHKLNPNVTRVVVDMKKWAKYRISKSKNGNQIFIDFECKTKSVSDDVYSGTDIITGLSVSLNPAAKDKLVVIDPGHGGTDPGALGKNESGLIELYEKDANLDISLKVAKLLESAGVKYFMTRTDDSTVGLYDRPVLANERNAALFVSIHNNAMENSSVNGTMVLCYPGEANPQYNISSTRLAELILEELVGKINTKDLGIRDGSKMVVINKTNMPAVIVEVAFVTNPDDRRNLMDDAFRQKTAEAIATAIIKALNESVQ